MEYIEMAAPVNLSYHNAKRELAIQNSRDRQLSIDQTSYRQQHPNPRPPQNPTGGGFQMSFINPNQLDKVLQVPVASRIPPAFGAGYRGGVLNKNRGTLSALLRQRSDDIVNQEMLKQGLPPMEGAPVESLDPLDSKKLELSGLFQEAYYILSTSQAEPTYSATGGPIRLITILQKIMLIILTIFPVIDDGDIKEIRQNVSQLYEEVDDYFTEVEGGEVSFDLLDEASVSQTGLTKIMTGVLRSLYIIRDLLDDIEGRPDLQPAEKKLLVKGKVSEVRKKLNASLKKMGAKESDFMTSDVMSAQSYNTSVPMFSPSVFGRQSTQSGRLSLGAPSGVASTQGNRGTYSEF
jgi:hypothetical protein